MKKKGQSSHLRQCQENGKNKVIFFPDVIEFREIVRGEESRTKYLDSVDTARTQ